jgi:hypothetical protein
MATRNYCLPATKKTLSPRETRMASRRKVSAAKAKANQLATTSGKQFKHRNISAIRKGKKLL